MEDQRENFDDVLFLEWPLQDQLLMVGGTVLVIILYLAMIYIFWRWIKANIQMPKEVSRAADALERIADALEKQS